MKKMKRLAAMLLALVMVLGMSITAFAETENLNGAVPSANDKANVTISGLKEDNTEATVTLYQIASGLYDQNNTKGYNGLEWVAGIKEIGTLPTTSAPNEEWVNSVSAGIASGSIKATVVTGGTTDGNGKYTANVGAGAYIAVIKGSGKYIYNPLFLAVTYNANGDLEAGDINTATALYAADGTVKRSEQDIDKQIDVDKSKVVIEDVEIKDKEAHSDNDSQHTASLGSVITYNVTPTIPYYPENAINKTLFITDRMSKGLTFDYKSLTIMIDGTAYPVDVKTGNITYNNTVIAKAMEVKENEKVVGFNLAFQYDALSAALAGTNGVIDSKRINVTYQARVNEDAVVGMEGNINKATLIFTRDPNVGGTYDDPEEVPIPDEANGLDQKEKEEIVYTYQLAFQKKGEGDDAAALEGAIFGIYKDEECTQLVDVVITNENGYAVSTQVAAGTYYVKEIQAPEGYTLNEKVYEVTANWTTATKKVEQTATTRKYTTEADKSMNGIQVGWILDGVFYSEKPSDGAKAAYVESETHTTTTLETVEENDKAGNGTTLLGEVIPNTKMSALPSTGGIGTTIFTIGGCLIMIVAAGLFFASRKKSAK